MDEEEDKEQMRDTASRDKFKREREDLSDRRRDLSPDRRKRERYVDDNRERPMMGRDRRFDLDRDRYDDRRPDYDRRDRDFRRSRSRSPSDRYRSRDYESYRPSSDSAPRRRRRDSRSPPSQKRRRRDDDKEDMDADGSESPERSSRRKGRASWPHDDNSGGSIGDEVPLKTYKQFLESQPDNITPSEAERKYEEYKNDHRKKFSRTFFDEQKNTDWFKEKYDPSVLAKNRAEKVENSKKSLELFKELLATSQDFNLDSNESDIETANIQAKNEEPEEGEHVPNGNKKEETDHKMEKEVEKPAETKMEITPTETKEEGETADSKAMEISKTIPKPNEQPAIEKNERQETNVIFIKTIPPSIGRTELEELFNKHEGYKRVTLSEVNRHKNFHRLGWAHFDSIANTKKALEALTGTRIKDFELMMTMNKQSTQEMYKKAKITPPVAAEDDRVSIDLEQAKQLVTLLDKEKGIEENPLFGEKFSIDKLSNIDRLDRMIGYLRIVHTFCYYCGEEYEDEDELYRKCALRHLRGRKGATEIPNGKCGHSCGLMVVITDSWASSLDQKIKYRIDHPENPDVYSGKNAIESKLEKFFQRNISKVEDEKHRCGICAKLFSGEHFVQKHLNLKHAEEVESVKKQALDKQYFDNYLNDPKRITQQHNQYGYGMMGRGTPGGQMRRYNTGYPMPTPMMAVPFYPPPYSYPPMMQQGGRGRGRGRGNRGMRPQQMPRGSPQEPADPRGLREYVDLDAPSDDTIQIDYGLLLEKK